MKVIETPLVDASVITVDKYEDERGFFIESFNEQQFIKELGYYDFVQDNHSKSIINENNSIPLDRAVAFYIVNKCSFSGLTESSSFSPQASNSNFSIRGIEKLPGYSEIISNWNINGYSYENLMEHDMHDGIFMYLDPPYDIKDNLYGKKGSMHKNFDHDQFAKDCDKYNIPMMVSYNSDQLVKDRFKGWNAAEFDLTYTMRSVGDYMRDQKKRKELILMNYGNETEGLIAC